MRTSAGSATYISSMTSKKLAALGALATLFCHFGPRPGWPCSNTWAARLLKFHPAVRGIVEAVDAQFFVFYSGKASWRVPYEKINLVEYGEKVDRRYIAAVLISPLFLLAKKRKHFLTVGYSDEEDHQQAMIFKINKDDIRATLVVLEARTGRKVEYQDDDARKSGKG